MEKGCRLELLTNREGFRISWDNVGGLGYANDLGPSAKVIQENGGPALKFEKGGCVPLTDSFTSNKFVTQQNYYRGIV